MIRMNLPNNEGLLPFVEKLDKTYYDEINALCDTAKKRAQKLQELEVHQTTSSYVILCIRLIEEIQDYISIKRERLVPYVRSLFEKEEADHDCRNCNGNGACNMEHDIQLAELKQSHTHLKDIINRLQMVALPLYSETIYPDIYRILRNNMALLENSLGELFLLEEAYLIPKVVEVQTNIHASD